MTHKIDVAEQFYSVQGEGVYAGEPSVFLRLAGCNLCCGGYENLQRDREDMEPEDDATWVCDTIEVWREATKSYDAEELVDTWDDMGWLSHLDTGGHLILTGGEPTMSHNRKGILPLMRELSMRGAIRPFTEVETNGTIRPTEEMAYFINQWNVSLKLSNSGMERGERINEDAIEWFINAHQEDKTSDAHFKFVVSREEDVQEILKLVTEFDIPEEMILLMPAGATQEELARTREKVARLCMQTGWRYTPRLQVNVWDQATGV